MRGGASAALRALACLGLGPLQAAPASPPWGLGPFQKADKANPVLMARDSAFDDPMRGAAVHWEHDEVFNPAATVRNGRICLLYRAEDDAGAGVGKHTSRLGLASSADGLHFTRRPTPGLYPAADAQKANEWPGGCEDPRLVETADGGYVLTYTGWNRQTARLAVATSRDLIHWDKHGPACAQAFGGKYAAQWSKSGSIVTRLTGDHLVAVKINGHFWMLWGEGTVYAATSDNLTDWTPVLDAKGALAPVLRPRPGHFDSALAEPGPPAVLTPRGIVFLYNGKNDGAHGDPRLKPGAYSGGQALLDSQDPTHVLQRPDGCFLTPERPYEVTGQYAAGTVFIEGLVHFKHRWWLYYGTADSMVAVASAPG